MKDTSVNGECVGCLLANKNLKVYPVYENEHVTCILDHNPFNEGHVLIIPKRHARYMDDLDVNTLQSVLEASQLISKGIRSLFEPDGITICQNGGKMDELTHFHMHVVPRFQNQDFSTFYDETPLENDEYKARLDITQTALTHIIQLLK